LKWLGRQSSPPEAYANSPIWTHRKKLNWEYRQKKNDYEIMKVAIDAFFEAGQPVLGVTLMETYAGFIYWERDSTQRRLKFDIEEWIQREDDLCVQHLKASRRPIGAPS
jgi:hypothetical protein